MSLQNSVIEFNKFDAITKLMKIELVNLQKRYNDRYYGNSWVEKLLQPFAKEMAVYLGKAKWEIMGPFGLANETSVWFYDTEEDRNDLSESNERNILSITFRPDFDFDKNPCGIVVRTDDAIESDKRDSVGGSSWNNYPSIVIPPADADLKWFAQFINK